MKNEDFSPMNPPKSNGYFKSKLSRGRTPVERNKSRLDENWVLSRSVPDSLHHSGLVGNFPSQNWSQLQRRDSEEPDDEELALSSLPKFSYLAAGRRAMYLPEYKSLNYLYQKCVCHPNGCCFWIGFYAYCLLFTGTGLMCQTSRPMYRSRAKTSPETIKRMTIISCRPWTKNRRDSEIRPVRSLLSRVPYDKSNERK